MKLSKPLVVRVLSIIVAWILCMLILLLTGLAILRFTLCDPDFLKQQIVNGNYTEIAAQELRENYKSYGAAGGFDNSVMESFVNEQELKNDILKAVDLMYGMDVPEQDYSTWQSNIYEALIENVESRDIRVTKEIESGVLTLAAACSSDYEQRTSIPFLHYLRPLIATIQKITLWALVGIFTGAAVCLWLLFGIHANKQQSLAYICQSAIAAAMLCCAVPLVLHALIPIQTLKLKPASLKLLLTEYVTCLFNSIWPFGIMLVVIAVVLGIVYYFVGQYAKHSRPKRRKDRNSYAAGI